MVVGCIYSSCLGNDSITAASVTTGCSDRAGGGGDDVVGSSSWMVLRKL